MILARLPFSLHLLRCLEKNIAFDPHKTADEMEYIQKV